MATLDKAEEKSVDSDESKEEFLNIVRILNRFYGENSEFADKGHAFRVEFAKQPVSNVDIKMKRFGEYEYLITAIIISENKTETWIHVDGIAEERKQLPSSHPVHEIICLQDIFEGKI